MGFENGRVILDRVTYTVGETIYGVIVFDQGMPVGLQGIYASCVGSCQVRWTKGSTVHEGCQEYINNKTYVFGGPNGKYQLLQGRHEYRFQLTIPEDSPSSFEGDHGHIRYQVKVVMVISSTMSNEKVSDINVISPVDLNEQSNMYFAKRPLDIEIRNSYTDCCCFSTGTATCRFKLRNAGFIPGAKLPLNITIDNQSSFKIKKSLFTFMQGISYICESGTIADTTPLEIYKDGPFKPHTRRSFTKTIKVPEIEVYNLNKCNLISITHWIQVAVCVEDREDQAEIEPIVIGTIPIKAFDGDENVSSTQGSLQPAPVVQPMPNMPVGNYPQNIPYPGVFYPAAASAPYPNPINQTYPNVSAYPLYPQFHAYPACNPPPAQPAANRNITVTVAAPSDTYSTVPAPAIAPDTATAPVALAANVPPTAPTPAAAPRPGTAPIPAPRTAPVSTSIYNNIINFQVCKPQEE